MSALIPALGDIRRLLVIKPSSLGDVVHTLPAAAALHRAHPQLEIRWVVNTEWAPLLRGNPALSGIIEFPRRQLRGWRDIGRARRWARENLAPFAPGMALDFQGLLRSALMARASRAGLTVGCARAREAAPLFYDLKIAVPDWKTTHAVDRYLGLVSALGVDTGGSPGFFLPEGDPVDLESASVAEPFVLLHPFSRGVGKSMTFHEVCALCEALGEIPAVIAGAGVEWPANPTLPRNAVDLLGQTSLPQLIWLMRRAEWIVSVDSGPMHLAAAITGRLLSIHTWTNPRMVGPCREDAWVWRDGKILRAKEIAPDQFPEDRSARGRFTDSVLPPGGPERIAQFVQSQLLK